MKYEIEYRYFPESGHRSLFSTITGLEPEEFDHLLKPSMTGKQFINSFRSLGFSTNDRFVKFDPDTEYPVVLRCKGDSDRWWYSFMYYDGIIWDPHNNEFYKLKDIKDMRYIKRRYYFTQYRLRITSMLQVWI